VCPHCRVIISLNQGLNAIPTCYALLNIIEDRIKLKKEECPRHEGHRADIVCMEDKCKICLCCIVYGEHKNHKIERFADFKGQVDKKIVELERFVEEVGKWPQDVEKILLEECQEVKAQLGEKFDALARVVMQEKETVLGEVDKSFRVEIEKIKGLGKENKDLEKKIEELKKMVIEARSEEFKVSMFSVFDGKVAELMVKPQEYERKNVKEYCEKIKSGLNQDFENQNGQVVAVLQGFENIQIKFPAFFGQPKIEVKVVEPFPFVPMKKPESLLNSNHNLLNVFTQKRGLFG